MSGDDLARWTNEQLDELQAECLRRHLLDPLWKRIADALGSVRFDKVDLSRKAESTAARLAEAEEVIEAFQAHQKAVEFHGYGGEDQLWDAAQEKLSQYAARASRVGTGDGT